MCVGGGGGKGSEGLVIILVDIHEREGGRRGGHAELTDVRVESYMTWVDRWESNGGGGGHVWRGGHR